MRNWKVRLSCHHNSFLDHQMRLRRLWTNNWMCVVYRLLSPTWSRTMTEVKFMFYRLATFCIVFKSCRFTENIGRMETCQVQTMNSTVCIECLGMNLTDSRLHSPELPWLRSLSIFTRAFLSWNKKASVNDSPVVNIQSETNDILGQRSLTCVKIEQTEGHLFHRRQWTRRMGHCNNFQLFKI